jgi:Zn-finger nucleic acid-binding protein
MHRRNFRKSSGVIIDRCTAHGTWLDADELEQIAGFILTGRQPSATLTERPKSLTPALRALDRYGRANRRHEGGLVGSAVDVLFGLLK